MPHDTAKARSRFAIRCQITERMAVNPSETRQHARAMVYRKTIKATGMTLLRAKLAGTPTAYGFFVWERERPSGPLVGHIYKIIRDGRQRGAARAVFFQKSTERGYDFGWFFRCVRIAKSIFASSGLNAL